MRLTALGGLGVVALAGGALALQLTGDGDEVPVNLDPPVPDATEGAPVIDDLRAQPTAVDEGGWIEFIASGSGGEGGTLRYSWDFGDGTDPREGEGLTSVRHQFRDGDEGGTEHRVVLRVGEAGGAVVARSLRVRIRNVAPEIRSLEQEGRGIVGERVGFRGAAFDPGLDDRLTYRWDFGDGATAGGAFVEHAFEEAGTYTVTLVVTDGDGGRDERALVVRVGAGFSYSISGDVLAQEEGRVFVSGAEGGANPRFREGYCAVRIGFRPENDVSPWGGSLTASLRSGLRRGSFPAGRKLQAPRPWADESERPGVFFGDWGTRFRTVSGAVTITYVDEGWVEGHFAAALEERRPYEDPDQRRPRTASVEGTFASELIREISGIDSYLCPTFETFAVESHRPARNAVNVDLENPVLEATFTEPLDRSTVHDGTLVLEYRLPGSEAGYRTLDGELTFVDDRSVRFTPSTTLPDGTLLCLRIRGGEAGVRGVDGEILETPPPPPAVTEGTGTELGGEAAPGTEEASGVDDPPAPARTYRACHAGGRRWGDAYEWGFGSLVELEAVRTELFQSARVEGDITLVPGKPTVARVFAEWSERGEVHPDAQVLRFPARVWVEADGRRIYPPRDVDLRRPDRYDAEERRLARNSVNLFDWRPGGSGTPDVRAHVEPTGQTRTPPRVHEGPSMPVQLWEHAPRFAFDTYFLRVGEWTTGVPENLRSGAAILTTRSEIYTTQNFPVLSTRGRHAGDFEVGLGDQAAAEGRQLREAIYDNLGIYYDAPAAYRQDLWAEQRARELYTFVRILTDQVAPYTGANALVVFAPSGYGGGGTSHVGQILADYWDAGGEPKTGRVPFRTITIHPRADIYRTTALTHEFGHAFWLQHVPPVADRDERAAECGRTRGIRPGIEGFRVSPSGRRGASKSSTHGNAESRQALFPIMHPCAQLATESFIRNDHYAALQEDMAAAIDGGFWTGPAVAVTEGARPRTHASGPAVRRAGVAGGLALAVTRAASRFGVSRPPVPTLQEERADGLLVSGLVGLQTEDGSEEAGLLPLRRVESLQRGASRPEGPYRVRLLAAGGRELAAAPFGTEDPGWTVPDGVPSYFSVALPSVEGLERIVVERDDRVLVERVAAGDAPSIRILEPPRQGATSGRTAVRWEATDPDGDALRYTVLYSPTGRQPWQVRAAFLLQQELTLDVGRLEPGPAPTLRVIASDGVHEGEASVPFTLDAPLSVLATLPAPGDTVEADVEPMIAFGTDVGEVGVREALSLRAADGPRVTANISLDAGARRGYLLPLEPLEPGRYTLTLAAGLEDRFGHVLTDPVTVPFVVAGSQANRTDTPEPGLADGPSTGAASESEPDAGRRPSEAEADALGPGGARWVSVRFSDGGPPPFSGSGLDGGAGARILCSAGSQANLTLFDGPTPDSSTTRLEMTTLEIVAPDDTGIYELENLQLLETVDGLSVSYGFGTLEITRHDAPEGREGHRLTGRLIEGSLEAADGRRFDVEAEFDLNVSCRQTLRDLIGRGGI